MVATACGTALQKESEKEPQFDQRGQKIGVPDHLNAASRPDWTQSEKIYQRFHAPLRWLCFALSSMKHAVRNGPSHAAQSIRQFTVVISLVPKVQDCENDQRRNEESHRIPSRSACAIFRKKSRYPIGLRFHVSPCNRLVVVGHLEDHFAAAKGNDHVAFQAAAISADADLSGMLKLSHRRNPPGGAVLSA
jgi:hypothetical protein